MDPCFHFDCCGHCEAGGSVPRDCNPPCGSYNDGKRLECVPPWAEQERVRMWQEHTNGDRDVD